VGWGGRKTPCGKFLECKNVLKHKDKKTLKSLFGSYWENKPQYICLGACATKKNSQNIKQIKKNEGDGFQL
jgi:hypothetical protein